MIYKKASELHKQETGNSLSALLVNVRSRYQNAGCLIPVIEDQKPVLIGIVESWE